MRLPSFLRLGLVLLVPLVAGCDDEQDPTRNPDDLFAYFELRHDENTGTTQAQASFRFGSSSGGLKKLKEGGKVFFNDQRLRFDVETTTYVLELEPATRSGEFRWETADGDVLRNAVELIPVSLPADFDSLAQSPPMEDSEPFQLFWEGDTLTNVQSMQLRLIPESAESQLFVQNNNCHNAEDCRDNMTLQWEVLSRLPVGIHTARLERRIEPSGIERTTVGTVVAGRYIAAEQSVVLSP